MDIENEDELRNYLVSVQGIDVDDITGVQVLKGGISNRTVLVRRASGKDLVIKQALQQLRVKDPWFSDPARIHREAEGIRILGPLTPPRAIVPFVFEDTENHILAMGAVPPPHYNWKTMLLEGVVDAGIVRQFGRCLAAIHRGFDMYAYPSDGILRDRGFFDSLRIEPYYMKSAERIEPARAFLLELIEQTRARQYTLVHGDYSPKNILVHAERIILLDHEVIHIGDPAFDVGFSLTHLLSKANHLPAHRHRFLEAAASYWRTYEEGLGDVSWRPSLTRFSIRHTLGCMLARVKGRSPLEYLTSDSQARQVHWVVATMDMPPETIIDLIYSFADFLDTCLE